MMHWRKHWLLWICMLGMGGAIASVMAPDFVAALRSYFWREVPCQIVSSRVSEEAFSPSVTHHVLKVDYTYSFNGRPYRCSRYTTSRHQGSTDAQAAEQAAMRYPSGSQAVCYVNPRRPEEAVLVRGQLWIGLMLLAPLLVVGLVMHESIFAWFDQRRRRSHVEQALPFSEVNDALKPDGRMVLFGALGLVMGFFFLGFCLVTPLQQWRRAQRWVERDARITHCELKSRSGIHGPEYSIELLYEYEFGGRRFRSSRRGFGLGIEDPVADQTAWVAAHPAGTSLKCRVNPEEPAEAVLESRFGLSWISLALGLLMTGFGFFMLGQLMNTRRLRRLSGAALAEYCLGRECTTALPMQVRPAPWLIAWGAFLAVPPLGAAGGWSLLKGLRALRNGQGDIINLLYGAAAVVGAGFCIVACWQYARRALRPRPMLQINPGTPRVGGTFHLEWKLPRARGSVAWLRIWLEGLEHAKVRHLIHGLHGPISEEKELKELFQSVLVAEPESRACESGRITVMVPAEAMHSFRGAKCGVSWQLKAQFGRDEAETLEYKFPILILPVRP